MARKTYDEKLELLHTKLVEMGKLCGKAIKSAIESLTSSTDEKMNEAIEADKEVDYLEKDIEELCVKLILREQPVASDLRKVVAAQKMIVDMERIGDQAADIADLSRFISGSNIISNTDIEKMGEEVSYMINEAVGSYLKLNYKMAEKVIKYDDVIDDLFTKTKGEIAEIIMKDKNKTEVALDLLLVIKYLERIGDHAANIAEWVLYVVSGSKKFRGNNVSQADLF